MSARFPDRHDVSRLHVRHSGMNSFHDPTQLAVYTGRETPLGRTCPTRWPVHRSRCCTTAIRYDRNQRHLLAKRACP